MDPNEGDGQDNYATDIVNILEIIIVADTHETLIRDISKYCDSREDDIFKIFSYIITAKTKEELQMHVVRYLCSRLPILCRLLGKMSFQNSKQTFRDTVMNNFQRQQETSSGASKMCDGGKNDTGTELVENLPEKSSDKEEKRNKKRRKSKYCEIEGDLSHIQREPKRSKGRDRVDSSSDKDENINQCENREANTDLQKVHTMIEILKEKRSQQSRNKVLEILRTNCKLRHLFMKEKARLGVRNIPVSLPSTEQNLKLNCPMENIQSEKSNTPSPNSSIVSGVDETERFALLNDFGPNARTNTFTRCLHEHQNCEFMQNQLPPFSQNLDYDCRQTVSYGITNVYDPNSYAQNFTTQTTAGIDSYQEATMSTQASNEHFYTDWT